MSKYRNKKTVYKGQTYHSLKEAEYARSLDYLRKATDSKHKVVSYTTQVPFPIEINGKKICTYYADFVVAYADGRSEIVDVKGYKTAMYRLKKKMVEAYYKIKIIEV